MLAYFALSTAAETKLSDGTGAGSASVAAQPEAASGPGAFARMKALLGRMKAWVEKWAVTDYALLALIILAFAESSFFPIPPDVLLIAMCIVKPPSSFTFAAACTIASTVGGLFGYLLGRLLYEPVVKPVARFIRIEKHLVTALDYYNKYDIWAVAIAGFTPIPYKVFTIAGGLAKLNVFNFTIASVLSRGARFFIVATVLYFFGAAAKRFIDKYFDILSVVFMVLLIGSFVLLGWYFNRKHKEKEKMRAAAGAASPGGEAAESRAERGNDAGAAEK